MSCTDSRPSRSNSSASCSHSPSPNVGRERAEARPAGLPRRAPENTERVKLRSRETSGGGAGGVSRVSQPSYPISESASSALGEVDAPGAGPAVARPNARVLDVHALDEPAERANLGRGVQTLVGERVGEVEVAAERIRADASRDRGDALGRAATLRSRGCTPCSAASGHSARNAATARSSSASLTSSPA